MGSCSGSSNPLAQLKKLTSPRVTSAPGPLQLRSAANVRKQLLLLLDPVLFRDPIGLENTWERKSLLLSEADAWRAGSHPPCPALIPSPKPWLGDCAIRIFC